VVAAIAILAGIVIVAINPAKQLADTRNAQRRVDVNTILNAIYQYAIDNRGNMPPDITTTKTEICKSQNGSACADAALVDLSPVTVNEVYITAIPSDPSIATTNGTGYFISKTANNRITVEATGEPASQIISVTR
jgi:type IV pilus assembly protein PilA